MNGVGSSSSCPVPSLLSITQEAIACNIESFDSLFQLPEELALSIFEVSNDEQIGCGPYLRLSKLRWRNAYLRFTVTTAQCCRGCLRRAN